MGVRFSESFPRFLLFQSRPCNWLALSSQNIPAGHAKDVGEENGTGTGVVERVVPGTSVAERVNAGLESE